MKKSMAKNMTIDALAQLTEERMQEVEREVKEGFRSVNENFGLVLKVLDGLRDDVKQSRAASRVEYAELVELKEDAEALKEDVRKIKKKMKV
jgi:hypothetical protein